MTTTRLLAPLLVAMAALSACLPGRDNPVDTANRPTAALAIENGPVDAEGRCDVSDSLDDQVSRGRCVFLSAAASADPQGSGDIVSYVFATSTNGDEGFVDLAAVVTTSDTFVLSPALLRRHAQDVEIRVRVTIEDSKGGTSTAEDRFKLLNTAPSIIQPGNRYVPAFGALWLRSNGKVGGALDVRLDAEAVDDEEDPLLFCWRARGEVAMWLPDTPCTAAALADSAICTATTEYVLDQVGEGGAEETHKAIEYELRVCDGNLWSRPSLASIVYENTPSWAVEESFSRAIIVDGGIRSEEIPYSIVGSPGFTLNGKDQVRAFFGFDDPSTPFKDSNLVRTQLVSDSAGIAASVVALDPDAIVRRVIPSPATDMVWVVAAIGSNGLGVYGVYGTGAGATFDGPWMPPSPVFAGDSTGVFAAVDGDTGDLWFSATFQQSVWELSGANGTVTQEVQIDLADHFPASETRMVTGIGLREHANELATDGPHEVWIANSTHVLIPGMGESSGVLIREPDGAIDTKKFAVASEVASAAGATLDFGFGPLFVSPATFYVFFFGEGVGYFALNAETHDVFMLSFAPSPLLGFTGAVNPASGQALYVDGGQQTLFRVTPEGASATLQTSEPLAGIERILRGTQLLTYLPESATSPARVLLGQGTGVEGILQRFGIPPLFGRASPTIDYSSGDLWVPSVIPVGAARYYVDGRLADFIHSADDGTPEGAPFGAAIHVSADPADGALWLVTVRDTSGNANVVWRVEPRGARPAGGIAASGGVVGFELAATDNILSIAAQPVVESTGGALVMLVRSDNGDDTFDHSLIRMSSDGTFDPALPVDLVTDGDVPQQVFMSRDLVTPGVCVAARNPSGNQIIVRRYGPRLVSYTGNIIPTPGAPRVLAVSAYDGDCWVAYRGGAGVNLALTRPSEIPPVILSLPPTSEPDSIVPVITSTTIRPVTEHRVLVSFPDESLLRRYVIGTNGTLVEDETLRTDGDVLLLAP